MKSYFARRSNFSSIAVLFVVGLAFYLFQRQTALPPIPDLKPDNTPSTLATWPWPLAEKDAPHKGVTHWHEHSSKDGTLLDLWEFDFKTNPRLKLELFDQDQHDEKPGDDRVDHWPLGVGHFVQRFDNQNGRIIAAWNGPFFGYDRKTSTYLSFHVAPVVLDGKVLYNKMNHRWAFGVKYVDNKPVFKTFHLPPRAVLEREFDWASSAEQCLIKDGKPLKVQPFPLPGATPIPRPVKSTPQEAGHITDFDHMKSCRISMAWSRDNLHFYLLAVKETDTEGDSIRNLRAVKLMGSGWMTSDVQNFWLSLQKSKGIWGAVNNDAGDAAQVIWRQPDNSWMLIPERMADPHMRMKLAPDYKTAPEGGTLMYWCVREF